MCRDFKFQIKMVKNEFTVVAHNKQVLGFFLNAKIKQLMHQSHETTQEDYKSFGKVWNEKKLCGHPQTGLPQFDQRGSYTKLHRQS